MNTNVNQRLLSVIRQLLEMDMHGQELQCLMEHSDHGVDLLEECYAAIASAEQVAQPCWSCSKPVTLAQRAAADGNCPHCAAELDLEDWPAAKQLAEPVQTGHCAACKIETATVRPCDICGVQTVPEQQAEPVGYVAPDELPAMQNGVCAFLYPQRNRSAMQPVFVQPPAQPVARDVLMLAAEIRDAVIQEVTRDNIVSITGAVVKRAKRIDLAAIVDRHAALPPAVTEGCGACGDGCKGQGCRLDRESPPTCKTCNGHGMIGGLLPNGGGYDGEPCPDCSAPQDAVAAPGTIIKLGLYGRAFDGPQDRRAYTYQHQPDNLDAGKLGRAAASTSPGGDSIDHGLSLLKELQARGFGVFELGDQQEGGAV